MTKSRPVVKNNLNEWYDWLADYIPKPIKSVVDKGFSEVTKSILSLHSIAKNTLKDFVVKDAEKENQEETKGEVILTPQEYDRALKGAYKSFVVSRLSKTDVDCYVHQVKPHVKALIESQLDEMLQVRWKKPVQSEGTQVIRDNTGDEYIKADMPFKSLTRQFFKGSDIEELIQRLFAHFKTQTEKPRIPESCFTLERLMHLHINFYKLAFKRGSSYIGLPQWIAVKKVVINPKNNDGNRLLPHH